MRNRVRAGRQFEGHLIAHARRIEPLRRDPPRIGKRVDGLQVRAGQRLAREHARRGDPLPLEREVAVYERHVHRRFFVKPGVTGLWQVSGRSNLSWEESVRLDLYYVENWSMTGDIIILWRTLRAVLRSEGAF